MLVHFIIIGTFTFSKMSCGLLSRYVDAGKIDNTLMQHIPKNVVTEIRKLVLNALKK